MTKLLALHFLTASDGSLVERDVLGNILSLRLAYNSGAAFSVATSHTLLLSLFSIFVGGAILRTSRRYVDVKWRIGAGLVVGGIFGNMADRLFRSPGVLTGEVVDWIHLAHWPTFNLADASIVTGAALVAALILRGIPQGSEPHNEV